MLVASAKLIADQPMSVNTANLIFFNGTEFLKAHILPVSLQFVASSLFQLFSQIEIKYKACNFKKFNITWIEGQIDICTLYKQIEKASVQVKHVQVLSAFVCQSWESYRVIFLVEQVQAELHDFSDHENLMTADIMSWKQALLKLLQIKNDDLSLIEAHN